MLPRKSKQLHAAIGTFSEINEEIQFHVAESVYGNGNNHLCERTSYYTYGILWTPPLTFIQQCEEHGITESLYPWPPREACWPPYRFSFDFGNLRQFFFQRTDLVHLTC